MFNLKKHSAKNVGISEFGLDQQRENLETVTPPYNGLLDSVRKNKENAVTTEGELDHKKDEMVTTEAQLEEYKPAKGLPKRTGNDKFDQLPISLLTQKTYQDEVQAFKDYAVKDNETEFWDTLLTDNEAPSTPSQLNNSFERFDNLSNSDIFKNKGVAKQVMATGDLKDADAMLYHIYRKSACENRELNNEELNAIDILTSKKVELITDLLKL